MLSLPHNDSIADMNYKLTDHFLHLNFLVVIVNHEDTKYPQLLALHP